MTTVIVRFVEMGFELPLGTFVPRVHVLIGMRNSNITDFAKLLCHRSERHQVLKNTCSELVCVSKKTWNGWAKLGSCPYGLEGTRAATSSLGCDTYVVYVTL